MQELSKPLPRTALRLETLARSRWLVPLLALVLAGVLMYRSPWSASNLEIVPDSVEYAIMAQRMATLGRWDLSINGASYPSRYPPWFSLLLAPAYALAPHLLGVGILVVLAFAFVGVLAAYAIGRRLAGEWGGAAAAVFLMTYRGYAAMARLLMTDVPAVALGLVGCALFLRMRSRPTGRDYLLAGLLVALALALRNESAAMLLPFGWLALRQREGRVRNFVALLLPAVCVAAATVGYNQATFGDWRRNGYQYWCPLPYDYRQLVFAPHYIRDNLSMLKAKQVLYALGLGVLGAALLWRRAADMRPVLVYLALAALPITLLHLFYFYPAYRFHLLGLALCCILGGAGLVSLVPEFLKTRAWLLPALLVAGIVVASFLRQPDSIPDRYLIAESLAKATPSNAVILTNLTPVYLEPLVVRGTQRQIVPMSRRVEYASKCIAPKRIKLPGPVPAYVPGHRYAFLLRYGARDVIPFTADEAPQKLEAWARSGVPVYLDGRTAAPFPLSSPRMGWVATPSTPWLLQLRSEDQPVAQDSGRHRS